MSRTLQRMATPRPSTVNEEARTVELVIASEHDCGDGVILSCRQLPEFGPAPVPVLLSHQNHTGAMAGRIRSLRVEARQVIGLAEFNDAPAADPGWQLARAGCAVSVGARLDPEALERQRTGPDLATRWRINECSLVPVGADPLACTRSLPESHPMTATIDSTIDNSNSPAPVERSAKELRRENAILRIAQSAGVTDPAVIDRWVDSDLTTERVSYEACRAMRVRLENGDVRSPDGPEPLGHPVRSYASPAQQRDLGGVLAAKLGITGPGIERSWAQMPMRSLIQEVLHNDPNCRGLDLAAMPLTKLVNRAFSSSDFTKSLESSTERMLLQAYEEAQTGVIALSTSRDLPDFRAMELVRVSQYGEISLKHEGGEYKTASFAEELAATLQAAEYGSIAVLTRKALANDQLDIFGRMISEMGRASARKERSELAARLLNDFTWTAANSASHTGATAAAIIGGITAATLDLRRQTDVDGNEISFEPRVVLAAPEQEAAVRQAMATYNPTTADGVNPYSMLRVEVDHYLPASTYYVADTAYPNLVIGRIAGGPVTSDEEEFKTGNRLFRVQSDFGTSVLDQRSIVKVAITG